jgi:DNA-binding CsgD family transcriptional regulator
MFLHHNTVQALSDLIRRINTRPPWEEPEGFFSSLHRMVPFDYSVAFLKMDPGNYRVVPSVLTLSNGGGDDSSVVANYNDYFWRFKKPILDRIMKRESLSFHLSTTLAASLPRDQAQEYRWDFWEKHKIRHSYARYFKTPEGWLSLYCSRSPGRPDFSAEEQLLLDLLAPHLERIASADPEQPALFADFHGKIVSADPQAEAILKGHPFLAARLRESLPAWIGPLSAEISLPLRVELREREEVYRLTLSKAGTRRALLFRIGFTLQKGPLPTAVVDRFAQQHRLSPREREILALAVAGKQMKEMAQQLGLATDTVKEYLGSVYRKVGVDGKGALVAKVLSMVPLKSTAETVIVAHD